MRAEWRKIRSAVPAAHHNHRKETRKQFGAATIGWCPEMIRRSANRAAEFQCGDLFRAELQLSVVKPFAALMFRRALATMRAVLQVCLVELPDLPFIIYPEKWIVDMSSTYSCLDRPFSMLA